MSRSLHIVHLYPKEMNIYGDTGNRLILQKRAEWRDIEVKISLVGVGDKIPTDADIILGGGGQDAGQDVVQSDLQEKASELHKLANDGVVMLMICGLYQLFGRKFVTSEGHEIKGIGIFALDTFGGQVRMIGNTIIGTPWGQLVGYENHSGVTELDRTASALGTMIQGDGNNAHDHSEGCIYKNVFGTYAHGPVLSKNPVFADELLSRALARKYGAVKLSSLDDKLELRAAEIAKIRPR